MRQTHSGSRGKRAQALAEMAVMVPFLVIGMMGMLDLGRAFYYQIAITNAVREGARYAATPFYVDRKLKRGQWKAIDNRGTVMAQGNIYQAKARRSQAQV